MKLKFKNKKISGIVTVLPEQNIPFEDEIKNYTFSEAQSMRLKKTMGYKQHRIAKDSTSTSDLCLFGIEQMLEKGYISKEDIGAVVVVTITPDHFVPHVSNIIQGELGLSSHVLCMDIGQGCCGFVMGLIQSCFLLEHLKDKKVVLFNADVLSHKVSKQDRNSYPLIGDAASVTVVENTDDESELCVVFDSDGSKRDVLIIPAGGSRLPCSAETAQLNDDGEGNIRCLNNMKMNGAEVFKFVQTEVPSLVLETLDYAGIDKNEIEWFLFHQPNKFMLNKLADRIGVPRDKVFMNIVENYGNSSGTTIPMVITHNLSREMKDDKLRCCLGAFGAGLSWCAMTADLGEMEFCEMLQSDL